MAPTTINLPVLTSTADGERRSVLFGFSDQLPDPQQSAREPMALAAPQFAAGSNPGAGSHPADALQSTPPQTPLPQRAEQWMAPGPVQVWQDGDLHGAESPDYLFLVRVVDPSIAGFRAATQREYQRLLRETRDRGFPTLVRFWNYVPEINAGEADRENYKQFCWGRAEAFDQCPLPLPAATAIGAHDGRLRIALLAARAGAPLQHIENPRQVQAYRYPRQYGPRSPAFARATWLGSPERGLLLVSGTASIVNHETRHEGDLPAQVQETRRNIEALVAGAGRAVAGLPPLVPLAVRFYLRDPQQLAQAEAAYSEHFAEFPVPLYLRGDVCRAALAMELEMVFASAGLR